MLVNRASKATANPSNRDRVLCREPQDRSAEEGQLVAVRIRLAGIARERQPVAWSRFELRQNESCSCRMDPRVERFVQPACSSS
jgi:hypothetical protein